MNERAEGTKIEVLKRWIREEICRFGRFDDVIYIVGESCSVEKREFIFRIYTDNYQYHIRAIDRKNDDGYLGCTTSCRKPRAGEDWNRGRDLPDGKFVRRTWEKIKNDIISYELVKIEKSMEFKGFMSDTDSDETKVKEM